MNARYLMIAIMAVYWLSPFAWGQEKSNDGPPIGEPKLRILFVANSYSLWNHMPRLLEEFIAAGQKREADVMPWVSAGAPLSWHLKDGRAMKWITGDAKEYIPGWERRVAVLREKLKAEPDSVKLKEELRNNEIVLSQAKSPKWDYVFLLFFTDDYQASDDEIAQRVKTLVDASRAHGATPIVWLPWGGTENLKKYAPLAQRLKVTLIPTSFAEQLARSGKLSAETQVRWGGGHPNARVTYLYASMFYAAMFDKSPEGLPVYKIRGTNEKEANLELAPEEARNLQRVAWQAIQEYRRLEADVVKNRQ